MANKSTRRLCRIVCPAPSMHYTAVRTSREFWILFARWMNLADHTFACGSAQISCVDSVCSLKLRCHTPKGSDTGMQTIAGPPLQEVICYENSTGCRRRSGATGVRARRADGVRGPRFGRRRPIPDGPGLAAGRPEWNLPNRGSEYWGCCLVGRG